MNPIQKEELYDHLSQFLKAKGVEMKDGSYPKAVQKGCSILADAINLSQKGITQAKVQIDKNLDRMRQVIHEKTAPKPPTKTDGSPKPKAQSPKPKAGRSKPKAAKKQANGPMGV
ncbi:MAG: hypothetical protein NT154_28310 [Verrucomicrobia bacterium]|nr:hypothetical protein [Verrucomicrobiota bacterium]